MAKNEFMITILDDGMTKVESDDFDEGKHMQADEFIEQLDDMLGEVIKVEKKEHEFLKNKKVLRGGKVVKAT